MDDPTRPPPTDRVVALLERDAREEAVGCLEAVREAPAEDRKATVGSLRSLARERPTAVGGICSALTPFLRDESRPVRLRTAKLFVALAEATPDAVVPAVPSLADRLADEDEFYYVRARCAEAIGYVALEHPDAVGDPEVLAEFRVGLSFDEPEVREKQAKALECVALGEPSRLSHQVSSLADHLDDGDELVRYHLTTALVAVGCEFPERLDRVREELLARLEDGSEHVQGRAAEALGLLARARGDEDPLPDEVRRRLEDVGGEHSFATDRVRFALGSLDRPGEGVDASGDVGDREGVRSTTDPAVEEIVSGDSECPHCGMALPEDGPPTCPQCGAPR